MKAKRFRRKLISTYLKKTKTTYMLLKLEYLSKKDDLHLEEAVLGERNHERKVKLMTWKIA